MAASQPASLQSSAGERATPRAIVWATAAATLLIAAYRRPDALVRPQFFVEDGTVFFAQDYTLGVHALYKPYAGYLHLVPRLVAWMSSVCPLEYRPTAYVWSCAAVLVGLSVLATSHRTDLPSRPAFALAPLLVPVGGFLYFHLTNIQWFLALAQLLMLVRRPPASIRGTLLDGTLLLLTGLTGPFCLVTLTLWPLRLLRYGRRRHEWLCLATLAMCAAVQLYFLRAGQPPQSQGGFSHITWAFLSKHAATMLLGMQWPKHLGSFSWAPAALLGVSLLLFLFGTPKPQRYQLLQIALFGATLFALVLFRIHPEAGGANAFTSGSRYFLLPYVCASWCALLALGGRQPIRIWASGFVLMLLLSAATHFDRPWPRDFAWQKYCDRIRSGQPVVVPINWPGWRIRLNFDD